MMRGECLRGCGRLALAGVLLLCWILPSATEAQVSRIEIESREDVLGGRPFGLAGSYEKLRGTIHFTLDPEDPGNSAIVDLKLAPRNRDGRVEFSADFYVLKPKEPGRGSRAVLFDVVNRGNKTVLRLFNHATGSPDPVTEAHFGDGFLMRQGLTVVWVGWQFDVLDATGRMRLESPVVTENGASIEGFARYWFRTNGPTRVQSLDGPARGTTPYRRRATVTSGTRTARLNSTTI